jgi:hypothetical protein
MTAKRKMVTAVFRDPVEGQTAYDGLINRGYRADEINILMSDATRASYFTAERPEPARAGNAAAQGVGVGGAIGTAVGATLAALMAVGSTVLIPGLGLAVAGPIAAALAGGGAGAVTGGIIGGLVGLGIPEPNAQAYQEALRDGGVVIGVTPRGDQDAAELKRYFEGLHGGSVCYC